MAGEEELGNPHESDAQCNGSGYGSELIGRSSVIAAAVNGQRSPDKEHGKRDSRADEHSRNIDPFHMEVIANQRHYDNEECKDESVH